MSIKKLYFICFCMLPLVGFTQSAVLDRFKQKVKARADQHLDEGIDKALDKTEDGINNSGKKNAQEQTEKPIASQKSDTAMPFFASYSRYDFVPGDEIVYAEDFSQDVIGEFPLKWATNNRGETVTVKGMDNKWLRMYQSSQFLSPYVKNLPENFTVEFDLIFNYSNPELSYVFPELDIRLLNAAAGDKRGKKYFNESEALSELKIAIGPENGESSTIYLYSAQNGSETFSNPPKSLARLSGYFGKPVHFALWIQKERLRLWMNGEKVYDIPQAVPLKANFNRIGLQIASSNYADDEVGYYLSNIKLAQGAPDMRSKLITEGKLITTGILFDVNSDKIKPESFGVLQEIAKVLKENGTVRVRICGHTDSDGDDANNLALSKRRANAVKQALSMQFGIDAARMETDGKGETQPVAPNTTAEGKSKNRRVEFTKL